MTAYLQLSYTEAGTLVACIILLCLWIARRSPLDAAPNAHWSVKYSSAWLRWHRYYDSDTLAVHAAHIRHGPVVRLAPNELSVCDAETGLRPIYEGRLPKTDWYRIARSYGTAPAFAIKDEESHRRRRRVAARPYTKSYIKSNVDWQAQQERLASELRRCLQGLAEKTEDVDMYDLFFAWSTSATSTYVFGSKGAVNLLYDLKEAHRLRARYAEELSTAFWLASRSAIPRRVLRWLGYSSEISYIARMRQSADGDHDKAVDIKTAQTKLTAYEYMKAEMLVKDDHGAKSPKEHTALCSEIQDHIVAGVDTSQTSLTICGWLLSLEKNHIWQDRLRSEMSGLRDSFRTSDIESLPILDAVVKETLRLYPPVAGCLPRITDKTVVLGPTGSQVSVPARVTVHSQAWTLHRNPSVFDNPDDWLPQRWLECSPERRREMDTWVWAFGSGSRRCLGESLAMTSMKVALATVYSGFETRCTDETNFKLHVGNFLLPLPDNNGRVLKLRIRRVRDTQ